MKKISIVVICLCVFFTCIIVSNATDICKKSTFKITDCDSKKETMVDKAEFRLALKYAKQFIAMDDALQNQRVYIYIKKDSIYVVWYAPDNKTVIYQLYFKQTKKTFAKEL